METRRNGDPAVERPAADRDGRALRAVEPTEPAAVDDVGPAAGRAALLTARQELDLCWCSWPPRRFSGPPTTGSGPTWRLGRRAQAAYARVCASTGTAGR
jgi:hypothetical protein